MESHCQQDNPTPTRDTPMVPAKTRQLTLGSVSGQLELTHDYEPDKSPPDPNRRRKRCQCPFVAEDKGVDERRALQHPNLKVSCADEEKTPVKIDMFEVHDTLGHHQSLSGGKLEAGETIFLSGLLTSVFEEGEKSKPVRVRNVGPVKNWHFSKDESAAGQSREITFVETDKAIYVLQNPDPKYKAMYRVTQDLIHLTQSLINHAIKEAEGEEETPYSLVKERVLAEAQCWRGQEDWKDALPFMIKALLSYDKSGEKEDRGKFSTENRVYLGLVGEHNTMNPEHPICHKTGQV